MGVCEGDLRRAITLLQSASQLKVGEEITKEDFYNLAGVGTVSLSNTTNLYHTGTARG